MININNMYLALEEILIHREDDSLYFKVSKSELFRMLRSSLNELNEEEYSFLEMLLANKDVITSNDMYALLHKLESIEK